VRAAARRARRRPGGAAGAVGKAFKHQ